MIVKKTTRIQPTTSTPSCSYEENEKHCFLALQLSHIKLSGNMYYLFKSGFLSIHESKQKNAHYFIR